MKILVANLGSTSFKYRLFDMADETRAGARRRRAHRLAAVEVLRRGRRPARGSDARRQGPRRRRAAVPATVDRQEVPDAARRSWRPSASRRSMPRGSPACSASMNSVLAAMEAYNDVAPAHNPPYVAAMRLLAKELPEIPLVAAFETGFHETIPPAEQALRGAAGMGREARHQALGLSRRQPSLHRRADGAAAGQARREDHLVPPRRQQFAVCDRGRQVAGEQPGHEPAVAACRTTTASATSTRSPCRR